MSDVEKKKSEPMYNKRDLILAVVLLIGFIVGYSGAVVVQSTQTHAVFVASGVGEYDYVNMYLYYGMNESLGNSYFKFSSYEENTTREVSPVFQGYTSIKQLQVQVLIDGSIYAGYIIADKQHNTTTTVHNVTISICYYEYKISYNEFDDNMLNWTFVIGFCDAVVLCFVVYAFMTSNEKARKRRER